MRLSPRHLLTLDALGAWMTFLGLLLFIGPNTEWLGFPEGWPYYLAAPALTLATYGSRRRLHPDRRRDTTTLLELAVMNVAYCGLSAYVMWMGAALLTGWGWAYLGTEMAIVLALAVLEWRTWAKHRTPTA